MKDEEINMAIAEACGWTDVQTVVGINLTKGIPPKGVLWVYGTYESGHAQVPNYCRDLNAMHDAEQHLFNGPEYDSRYEFVSHLARILNPVHGYRMTDGVDLLDASARQRAEAFLRTIGKWKEEE